MGNLETAKRGEGLKKFIVEFGMGTDFHGQDVTKAARKAVRLSLIHI